ANFSGTDSFTYRAADAFVAGNLTAVTITVTAVADVPTLTVTNASGVEGSAIPLTIQAALTDTDGSEALTITVSSVPAGVVLSAGTNQGGGVWALTAAQLAGLTLSAPDNSTFTLTVVATATESSNGASASATASLTVTVANADPVITALATSAPTVG